MSAGNEKVVGEVNRPRARVHRWSAWSAVAALVMTFGGMLVAGWLPPPHPGDSAAEVGMYYRTHADAIRVASIMIFIGGVLLLPYVAVVSVYVNRMEGGRGPLGYLQLVSGVLGPIAFIVPSFLWAAAAFDPGRADEITKVLHDAAWLAFIAGIWTFVVQNVAIGTTVFTDRHADPVLPRWLGYMAFWSALLFMPSCLVLFFHHGPFGWNGIFTFWLAAAAFVVWTVSVIVTLQPAITRFAAPDLPARDDAGPAGSDAPVLERAPA